MNMFRIPLRAALAGLLVAVSYNLASAQTFTRTVVHDTNGNGATRVLTADLNGDGKEDLVVVEKIAVSIEMNVGVVPFPVAPTLVSTHVTGSCAAVGDVNGD